MLRKSLLICLLFTCLLPARLVAGTILVLGDSLSSSYGMLLEDGWVALLQQRLQSERLYHTVINASISGDTTAAALTRLPRALERHQPDILVLQIGGNDGLRALSLDEMRRNIAMMIMAAREHGARVLLLGVHLPPNYGRQYTERFHAVYRELAEELDVALVPSLVDGVGQHSGLMQSDGIHPSAGAQPIILDKVWPELRPML